MREVKFRAWDAKNKRLFYLDRHGLLDSGAEQIMFVCSDLSGDPKRFEWMQYTGLKDKNGKEIYEGDRWQYGKGGFIGIVEFKYSQWQFTEAPDSPCTSYPYFYSNAERGEVIGNIYENPELS